MILPSLKVTLEVWPIADSSVAGMCGVLTEIVPKMCEVIIVAQTTTRITSAVLFSLQDMIQ